MNKTAFLLGKKSRKVFCCCCCCPFVRTRRVIDRPNEKFDSLPIGRYFNLPVVMRHQIVDLTRWCQTKDISRKKKRWWNIWWNALDSWRHWAPPRFETINDSQLEDNNNIRRNGIAWWWPADSLTRAHKLVKRIASTTAVLLEKNSCCWGFKFRDREED